LSDSNRDLAQSYEKKISLLTNALNRERKAKLQLETKLDEYNQKSYQASQELLESYESARIRQIQLQFLTFLSSEHTENKNLSQMSRYFIDNVIQLLGNCNALIISMHNNTPTSFDQIDAVNANWKSNFELLATNKALANEIELLNKLESNSWHRYFGNKNYPQLYNISNQNTLLCLVISLNHTTKQIFVIGLNHFCYCEEFKQTLTIAAEQYSSIINKRITDVELSHNYSKLKKTLQALKSTQRKLSHNDKMASLGQLAAGVAHEINNPLSFIGSNLNTLKDYIDLYEANLNLKTGGQDTSLEFARNDVYELLESCSVGVNRVSDIVNSLKSFSKKEENTFVILDVHDVIQESLKIVENQFKYHHDIIQKLFTEPLIIKGNFGKLQQVFINLFINAVQAMPDSGTLTIVSSMANHSAIIKIIDTGYGMSPKTLKKIFEPFYTTKNESEGTGLGLSVSYAIVINHNGQINVNSEIDSGSEFTLTLPLYMES